ncbi:MAG: sigma-70 family RNA polymerase sigma factor [Gracilibacteraceae bacterium]|jgi:RNA polymerase sigma-70 factor (ECF subfamily)|nr:sigma-70 family RNA polymerase sigma factor [Gracilibacteraceae bacterium]
MYSTPLSAEAKLKLEALYVKYHARLIKYAGTILQNRYSAEDAVHQSFAKLLGRAAADRLNGAEPDALLFIVTKHTCLDILRTKRMNNKALDSLGETSEEGGLPEDIIARRESYDEVVQSLKGMGENYYNVMVLRYVYGFNEREIADLLPISYENVRACVHRAKKYVADKLRGRDDRA